MSDTNVVPIARPEPEHQDVLTEIAREGARRMLASALEAEVEAFVAAHKDLTGGDDRKRVVRNGFLPARQIQTGIGAIQVQVPRARDRGGPDAGGHVGFSSKIVPSYLRRSRSVEEFLPWLYLKGVSSGDFADTLKALVGLDAPQGPGQSRGGRLSVWHGASPLME